MSVYVDDLFPTERNRQWPYDQACHLTADTDDELHAMADRLGLRRSWAQHMNREPWYHHYDLTASKRREAVRLGAVEESAHESVTRRRGPRCVTSTSQGANSAEGRGIE